MKINKIAIFSFVIVTVIAIVLLFIPTNNAKLSAEVFLEKYKNTSNAVLIDVRTPEEFNAGHIPSSINIDFENLSFKSEIEKLDKSKTYFIYCRSGNRSGQAAIIMKANGIKNIYDLQGGIISNKDSIKLVDSNNSEAEYVVDESDMVNGQALISGIEKSALTDKEKLGLIQMREEEKLARDVYITLGNVWGLGVFSNISSSEQTHTTVIKMLLDKYEIKDPVVSDNVGVFTSKAMQDLYNSLVAKGKTSITEALIVGATIEDLDIHDLDLLKKVTDNEDILIAYNNLQKGSRNHMRAFVRNIQTVGGNYVPQYISKSDYTTILNTPQERGRQ